jgi:hypothetical protein
MKRLKIILLIMLWLTSQQVAATMSAAMLAPGTVPHAGKQAMQMDCHSAGSTSTLQENGESAGSAHGHLQSASPCCQIYCQCIAISGFAMPANMSSPPFVSHKLSLQIPYLLVIPQAPETSLYRPPISV